MVSIILPVYNSQNYLSECIQSVLKQTYRHWELFIINDGSTDSSKEIILSFSDSRIRYFEQENRGVSSARNIGLSRMKGDFFCFLDADDVLPQESLENRIAMFENNQLTKFVDGVVFRMDHSIKKMKNSWSPDFIGSPLIDLVRLGEKTFFGPTWLIKRNTNKEYRMQEGLTHGEDLLFYMELAREGGEYNYTKEPILYYRDTPGSAMKNIKGLEEGYSSIYNTIKQWSEISHSDLEEYKRKTQRIILHSYLRRGDFKKALSVWRKWLD